MATKPEGYLFKNEYKNFSKTLTMRCLPVVRNYWPNTWYIQVIQANQRSSGAWRRWKPISASLGICSPHCLMRVIKFSSGTTRCRGRAIPGTLPGQPSACWKAWYDWQKVDFLQQIILLLGVQCEQDMGLGTMNSEMSEDDLWGACSQLLKK